MKRLFALMLLASGLAVQAQTPAPVAPAVVAPPAVLPVAKPAKATRPRAPKAVAAPNPNLVEAKTATGKTVHYDCSKKGNLHKVACKK